MSTLVGTTPAIAVRRVKRHRARRRLADVLTYLGLAVTLVFFLGPFFWIVTTSLKGNNDFFAFPPVWIPSDPSLAHYAGLFTRASGLRYFMNSLTISSMSMGTYSAGTSSQTSHDIISCSRSEEIGSGSGHPRSR